MSSALGFVGWWQGEGEQGATGLSYPVRPIALAPELMKGLRACVCVCVTRPAAAALP